MYRFKPTFGVMMVLVFRLYTESTQSNSGCTQSLHRVIWGLHRVYTEQYGSIQSPHRVLLGQHRVYIEWIRSTQSLHRVIGIYTESTQSDAGLHRINTEWFLVNTESTQSNEDLQRIYTKQYVSTQSNFETTQSLHRAI